MNDRKVFHDSVIPLPSQPGSTRLGLVVNAADVSDRNEKMKVLFSMAMDQAAQAELERRVANGEVVSFDELKGKYAPNAADVKELTEWLKAQGFRILRIAPDGTGVYAQATVAQIEQSLQVNMVGVTKDGLTYTAAQDAPSLPMAIGKNVQAIVGLQPFRHAHKHSRKRLPKNSNRAGCTTAATVEAVPEPAIANAPPYLVAEVANAYQAASLGVTGKGQTIAILIDTVPSDSDLTAFWQHNNVNDDLSRVTKINVQNTPLPPQEGEETLDVEWTSGIAPDASIRVYASGSLQFVDLDMALDSIIADLPSQPGLRQLSISLGLGETFMGGPNGEIATQHQKFLRLAAAGINVFVSSGDAGSNPDETGHNSDGPTQAEYESSDPFVIGVGGTSLTLAEDGSVAAETGWSGSGGGESIFFDRPAWQTRPGMPPGTKRLVPDVSVTADPDNGAFLFLNGKTVQIGGTSWSAPVWAGFCALINEARANNGKPALPFLSPLLYPLMGTKCFRDIQTGSNGAFDAGPGYDMVTGIGVPNVGELIGALTK